VDGDLALLASHSPRWVSLSAHDSSDAVIDDFRRVFGSAYHDLLVGDWQTVAERVPQGDAAHDATPPVGAL
jgi:hypothetical protein